MVLTLPALVAVENVFPMDLERYMQNHSSACANVYNNKIVTSIQKYIIENPLTPLDPTLFGGLNISLEEVRNGSNLGYLNMGSGTTGTREFTSLLCQNNITSLHYTKDCGMSPTKSLAKWNGILDNCLIHHDCKSNRELLDQLARTIIQISHMKPMPGWSKLGVSDTPIDILYPYILPVFNLSFMFQTIRDPTTWWYKRRSEHRFSMFPICKMEYWHKVKHPFDIIGCLHLGDVPQSVLMSHQDYDDTVANVIYIEAYKKMTIYNSLITPKGKLHIMCLWDHSRNESILSSDVLGLILSDLS